MPKERRSPAWRVANSTLDKTLVKNLSGSGILWGAWRASPSRRGAAELPPRERASHRGEDNLVNQVMMRDVRQCPPKILCLAYKRMRRRYRFRVRPRTRAALRTAPPKPKKPENR